MIRKQWVRHLGLSGVVGSSLAACPSWAQEAAGESGETRERSTRLEELRVVGHAEETMQRRLAGSLARQGANVRVLDADEIANSGASDIRQAIQLLAPGVYFEGDGGMRAGGEDVGMSIRGGNDREFIVLVDGVRTENRTSFGSRLDISPELIERIEVLKDGQSLFYGTNAQVGVINMITKDFRYAETGEFMLMSGRSAGQRSLEEMNFGGHVNIELGEHRLQLFGAQNHSMMEPLDLDEADFAEGTNMREIESGLTSIGLKHRWTLNDDERLELFLNHNIVRSQRTPSEPQKEIDSWRKRDNDVAYLQWERNWQGGGSLGVRAFWNEQDQPRRETLLESDGTLSTRKRRSLSRDYGVHVMGELEQLGASWTYGAELARQDGFNVGTQGAPGLEPETSFDTFLQYRPRLDELPDTNVSFGVRSNANDRSENAVIWQILGRHRLTGDLSLRGSVGTSFQVPRSVDIIDRDNEFDQVINDAGPETSIAYDVGLEGASLPLTEMPGTWSVSIFDQEITDRVDDEELAGGRILRFFNRDEPTLIRGAETTVNLSPRPRWSVSFSATYTDAYQQDEEGPEGDQLEDIPEFYAKLQLGWDDEPGRKGWRLSAVYTGEILTDVSPCCGNPANFRKRGERVVADLSGYYFIDAAQTQRIGLRVENVFDEERANGLGILDDGTVFKKLGAPRTLGVSYRQRF